MLTATEYWEDILCLNFTCELARYKVLCGSQEKKVVVAADGAYYITHAEWKEHIVETFSVLPKDKLQELRFYLCNEKRKSALIDTSNGTTLIPLILAMLTLIISQIMEIYFKTINATFFGILGITAGIFIAMSKTIYGMLRDDRLKQLFYEDLEEIVIELLQAPEIIKQT